ncbi:MAG: response regulator [Elusimicrobia bacterium]|nr:response regulator [Elusimicrobiota bacterium]
MTGERKTVLLVDDELGVRKVLERTLRQDGYEILTARDGNEAWELIKTCSPDMVLLDLMMPGMDGTELCRRVRQDPSTQHMPIIMVTAKGRIIDAVEGLDGGADDYVVKPFDPQELRLRVAGLLRRCEPEAQATPAPTSSAGLETVLVVDDQPSVRRVVARVLRDTRPECAVAEAADLPQAKRLLADLRPKLLITDIRLPSGSGLQLCRFIQGHPWFYKTRVLIITGYPSLQTRGNAFTQGACEFLPKPFQASELAHSIGRLLA